MWLNDNSRIKETNSCTTPSCNAFMRYLLSENKQKIIFKEEGISTCPFYNSDTHSYKKQEKASEIIALKVINKISGKHEAMVKSTKMEKYVEIKQLY